MVRRFSTLGILLLTGLLLVSCGGGGASFPPARQLITLAVDPSAAEAVAPNGKSPFNAIGTFDQEPKTETNLAATWTSSDTTVVTIDFNGVATCVAVGGPVNITASVNGNGTTIQGIGTLTCLPSPPPPPATATGNCVYICPGILRCPQLTGYCAGERDGACRKSYQPGACRRGRPAGQPGQSSCGDAVDLATSCTP